SRGAHASGGHRTGWSSSLRSRAGWSRVVREWSTSGRRGVGPRAETSGVLREPPHQAFAAEALALRQLVRAEPDDAREEQVDLVDLGATTARVVLDARVRIAERPDHRRTGGPRPALDAAEVEPRVAAAAGP